MTASLEKLYISEAEKAPPPDLVGQTIAKLFCDSSPAFRTAIGVDARALFTLRRVVPDTLFASGVRRFIGLRRAR